MNKKKFPVNWCKRFDWEFFYGNGFVYKRKNVYLTKTC